MDVRALDRIMHEIDFAAVDRPTRLSPSVGSFITTVCPSVSALIVLCVKFNVESWSGM
jgi:hypothetical protein